VAESNFRGLVAYRLAAELGDELYRRVAAWSSLDQWTMGVQLLRAADSVGANIAEASGRWTEVERRRFLLVARGSLHELEHWVARAHAREALEEELGPRLEELARTLNGLIRRHRPR
jgi:four helix bundle protein